MTKLLTHEPLQQQVPDGLKCGVGNHKFHIAAAIFHIDAHLDQNCCIGRARNSGKARIGFKPVKIQCDIGQRLERHFHILQNHLDEALNQR